MIYHIRKPLARRGGNNFYRDKTIRPAFTYCGAAVTEFDFGHRDRAIVWQNRDNVEMTPCKDCVKIRTDIKGGAQ